MENKPVIYRKVLLRVVFWALGLAVCFGAAGVIFAGHDTLWRIVGTCAATATGAFLMLAASRQLDQETTWLSGVMAVALIVIEYLASLGLIWNLFRSAEEPAALTMLSLAANRCRLWRRSGPRSIEVNGWPFAPRLSFHFSPGFLDII
jgi:hypothetical protein